MATIIVENGSIVTGANSYVTEAELATYASDRGITISGTEAVLIIQAMDYVENLEFIGIKTEEDQPLQWPRYDAVVDNYLIDSDAIPQLLKDGQMEACLAIDAGNDPLANVARQTKKEKVDVLEVEYMDNASSKTIVKRITNKLRKLINGSVSGISFVVRRG